MNIPQSHPIPNSKKVREPNRAHFMMITHEFWENWAPVLSRPAMLVFLSLMHSADFYTHQIRGYWSTQTCAYQLSLSRNTVCKALSELKKYGLVTVIPANGERSHYDINQSVTPPDGAREKPMSTRRHWAGKWRKKSERPVNQSDTGPVSDWLTGPVNQSDTGPVNQSDTGPVNQSDTGPANQSDTAYYRPRDLQPEKPPDDDDDGTRFGLPEITKMFEGFGLVIDKRMGECLIEVMRRAQPDISLLELEMVAKDRIPLVLLNPKVRNKVQYLIISMKGIAESPAFSAIRKLAHGLDEQRRKDEEYEAYLNEVRKAKGFHLPEAQA